MLIAYFHLKFLHFYIDIVLAYNLLYCYTYISAVNVKCHNCLEAQQQEPSEKKSEIEI